MKLKAMFVAGLALGLAGAALAQSAQDWGDQPDEIAMVPAAAPSRALCRQLRRAEPPAADRPTPAQRRGLAGCRSDALYYGIGMARDPGRARLCAFAEMDEHRDDAPFSGRVMLMTVYANGEGAARNLDVAIHLACGIEGAPAEMDGRIGHLAALRSGRREPKAFDYCDDITSGLAGGYCASRAEELRGVARERALAAIVARWPLPRQQGFAGLRRIHNSFVDAHGANEVDLTGTLRAALVTEAEARLRDEFLDIVTRLDRGRAPRATHAQLVAADARLNRAYVAIRRASGDGGDGSVRPDGIRTAQRAWLAYRDAFLAFAARTFPAASRDGLATWLTDRRTAMLRSG